MEDGAVAERFGAKRVLADRLQDAAERRVDRPEQHQESDRDDGEDEIIGQDLAREGDAEKLVLGELEARPQRLRNLERAAVLAPGQSRELRSEHIEGVGDRQRHHGEEDRLHSEREEADRQRQR